MKNVWKKITILAVMLVLVMMLGACGKEDGSSAGNSNVSENNTEDGKTDDASSDNGEEEAAEGSGELKVVRFGHAGNNGVAGGLMGFVETNGILEEELNAVGYTADIKGFETGGSGVNEALASGQIDIGGGTDFPSIIGHANGIDNTLFSVYDKVVEIEIIAKSDSIQNIEDLKGKKIGVQLGTVQQRFITTVLASAGLTTDDVEILNMTSSESAAALDTGDIDAMSSVILYTVKLTDADPAVHVVATTKDHPEWASPSVLVGNNSYLEENPDVAVAIIKALIRGKELAIEDPENYYQVTADALGIEYDLQVIVENHDGGTFETRAIGITDDVAEIIRNDYEYMLEQGFIENEIDIDAWLDNSYYEEAVK